MIRRLLVGFRNPKLFLLFILDYKIFNLIPDSIFLRLKYRVKVGKKLNLNTPTSFNEKLQWLKLYDRNPNYTKLVDKFEVRNFISESIGKKYLIPLIGVWDNFEEINFDKLPNQFVLKSTHDSGGVIICKDKSKLDIDNARKILNKSLKRNYFYHGREWPYKNVKPRIICEEYMVDESKTELKDYKIFCFGGEPKLVQVDFNRFINHKRNFYDKNWNYIDMSIKYPNDPSVKIKCPEKLIEMLELARELAKKMQHIRIDFYYIHGKVYFGEMTFFHESGYGKFHPEEFDTKLGNLIKLPK